MAKVGYIFIATNGEEYAEDKAWMQQYGCVQVIEELSEHERLRPMWKQLISSLERGDELVVSRFSNALRGTRELATFSVEVYLYASQEMIDAANNGTLN